MPWRHQLVLESSINFCIGSNMRGQCKFIIQHRSAVLIFTRHTAWWRHEKFPALLTIYAGNSPVPGEFPAQRSVTRSFDVFFYLRLNIRRSKQSWGWWFETPSGSLWRHSNGCEENPKPDFWCVWFTYSMMTSWNGNIKGNSIVYCMVNCQLLAQLCSKLCRYSQNLSWTNSKFGHHRKRNNKFGRVYILHYYSTVYFWISDITHWVIWVQTISIVHLFHWLQRYKSSYSMSPVDRKQSQFSLSES